MGGRPGDRDPAASLPRPGLKYRLLPGRSEQLPGVAAPLYAQAFLALQERKLDDSTWKKLQDDWLRAPLEELPREELGKALSQMARHFTAWSKRRCGPGTDWT